MRVLLLTSFALACAAPAAAQEIIVTADREALLRESPGSVARLDGDELATIGAQVPSEALNRLPGVSIQRNNGVENLIAIRSPVLTGGQSAGSFLVLDNGVPIRAPGFSNVNQIWETSFDFADGITVIRGPGSALYGSNAVHGVVDVQGPEGHGAQGLTRARLDHSSLGRTSAGAVFAGGWSERDPPEVVLLDGARPAPRDHELMLSLFGEQDAGWRDQSGLGRQSLLVRYAHRSPGGERRVDASLIAQNLNQESAGFIEGPNAYRSRALAESNPVPEAYRDARLVRGQAAFTWRGEGRAVRIAPFARFIEGDLNLFFFPSRAQEISRQAGAGVQASIAFDVTPALAVIVGADVDQTRGELIEFQARPTTGTFTQGLHYDYAVDMTAGGVYAQADWAFAPAWRLTAGVRAEGVRYVYDNRAPDGDVGRFRRPADRTDTFEGLAPRLRLSREGEDSALWLSLARGARPPQITDLYSLQTRQNPAEQRLETLDAVELGWRRRFGDGYVEVVAYAMDKRDTSFRGADGLTVTGGRTRHQGVELSGAIALSRSWAVAGWASFSDQTYRFDSPADGIRHGAQIDTALERLANLRLTWRPLERVSTELEWTHVGPSFTDAANTRRYDGHDVFGLRGSFALTDEIELFAAVRNLANSGYADRADFAFGQDRYFPGAPRSLTLGVRYTGRASFWR
jgi:outer membrane receptor protein involved in Fe transport